MLEILIESHHERRVDICAAYLVTEDVSLYRVVILHFLLEILWASQVGGAL